MAKVPKRPNILFILTDEERYPVPEEDEKLKAFREQHLPARRRLQETGITFHNHHVSSCACTPSRACLFTGQYPSVHGVKETYGFAKTEKDPRITWLREGEVPTMGHYFEQAGYETVYKGKWHISHENLVGEDGQELETTTEDAQRIPEAERVYLEKQPLKKFGFSDWIGQEPHGAKIQNGGVNRDPTYSDQVSEYLQEREARLQQGEDLRPFFLVASLVNPHDIALYPHFKSQGLELTDERVPEVPPSPSDEEDLETKPAAQRSYRDVFENVYCPPEVHKMIFGNKQDLRRLYYHLHMAVDQDIQKIYESLRSTSFFNDTIIVFTSDHGDLLGSHGGLLQKWTVAYQEVLHVPLVISAPFLPQGTETSFVTSHVDLLPTMLGLAQADYSQILERLQASFSEAHPLVGNDFSRVIQGQLPPASQAWNTAYFTSEDEITKGNSQVSIRGGVEYDPVRDACHIEAIVTFLPEKHSGERRLWKFVRYFDNPARWSHPYKKDVSIVRQGPQRGKVVVRTTPFKEDFELYDLSADPNELRNLAHPTVFDQLRGMEAEEVGRALMLLSGRLHSVSLERNPRRNQPHPLREIVPTYAVESKL